MNESIREYTGGPGLGVLLAVLVAAVGIGLAYERHGLVGLLLAVVPVVVTAVLVVRAVNRRSSSGRS